jgi:hypothetical protein
VRKNSQFCGGCAEFRCKDKNKVYVDDPRDDFNITRGGADYGGIY